ncbi:hypothetical protein R6Q59_025185 [Mikania micrantha]
MAANWRLASFLTRFGGWVYVRLRMYPYAFMALRAQSWSLQDHILRDCCMDGFDSDYGCGMDRLRRSLPDFDLRSFTNNDTAPLKAQHVLESALFSGIIQNL